MIGPLLGYLMFEEHYLPASRSQSLSLPVKDAGDERGLAGDEGEVEFVDRPEWARTADGGSSGGGEKEDIVGWRAGGWALGKDYCCYFYLSLKRRPTTTNTEEGWGAGAGGCRGRGRCCHVCGYCAEERGSEKVASRERVLNDGGGGTSFWVTPTLPSFLPSFLPPPPSEDASPLH